MEQLILKIKQKDKLPFLKELLKRMEFVEIVEVPSKRKKEVLKSIEESVEFVQQYEKGKTIGHFSSAKDMIKSLEE